MQSKIILVDMFTTRLLRSICFLGLFLGLSIPAHAQLQQLELVPLQNQNRNIVFRDFPDDAAIIITSSLTNLSFESNVEIKADKSSPNDGEYQLIIPPFRQTITVSAPGYQQLRFTVPVSQAREVVFYEIRPLVEEVDLIPITFLVSPLSANATVYVDERVVDINSLLRLESGNHTVRIEADGYKTITDNIDVGESSFRFQYALEQLQLQKVTYRSVPDNARLEINNIDKGNTPFEEFVFPGQYFVRMSKSGYQTVQRTVEVIENPTNDPSINNFEFQLTDISGRLELTVEPADAQVFLNRQPYTGQTSIRLSPNNYRLDVQKQGYENFSKTIVITEGAVVQETVTLNQIVGSLQMTIQPISATVSLYNSSGQYVQQWTGGNIINNLPIGNYTIRATADAHDNYQESFTIRENQSTVLNSRMTPLSEIEQRELERQRQLEADRANAQAARERQQAEEAARDARMAKFSRSSFGGLYLHYNTFTADANAFKTNVEEQYGLGIGFFNYKNYITTSFDFVYNSYTIVTSTELPDEIVSYAFSGAFVPTLPLGPFMFGVGAGLDFTQYEDANDYNYYYTADGFYSLQASFKPKSWGLGFMIDTRKSIDLGLTEIYNPWTQVRMSLIIGN